MRVYIQIGFWSNRLKKFFIVFRLELMCMSFIEIIRKDSFIHIHYFQLPVIVSGSHFESKTEFKDVVGSVKIRIVT